MSSKVRLLHFIRYSAAPLTQVHDDTIIQDGTDHRGSKPNGVWFSVVSEEDGSDGWRDYCKANGKMLEPYRTELVLDQDAILWVRTKAEIDKLTDDYGYSPPIPAEFLKSKSDYTRSAICWKRLATKYGGIVIAPYCAERRQKKLWYYTWDCASGCVWNSNAVRELRPFP
jgi:hypothetical protein